MSENVLIALIVAGQAIGVAFIGFIGVLVNQLRGEVKKVKVDTAAAREQVENNHKHPDGTPINLREENDSRHTEVLSTVSEGFSGIRTWVESKFTEVAKDFGGIRQELRDDRQAHREDHQANLQEIKALDTRVDTVTTEIASVAAKMTNLATEIIRKDN